MPLPLPPTRRVTMLNVSNGESYSGVVSGVEPPAGPGWNTGLALGQGGRYRFLNQISEGPYFALRVCWTMILLGCASPGPTQTSGTHNLNGPATSITVLTLTQSELSVATKEKKCELAL